MLVHYLNVPYPDDNKMAVIAPSLALWGDKKEWTKEELVSQLKPMCKITRGIYANPVSPFPLDLFLLILPRLFSISSHLILVFSEDEPDATNDIEISVSFDRLYTHVNGPLRIFIYHSLTIQLIFTQTAETVETIVGQLMEKQRLARQAALVIKKQI